ncbi:MAG TPA: glycoside hydrolase family 2 TIM barrel-domain containing protein, partial [Vicinamibacterales bacterium]
WIIVKELVHIALDGVKITTPDVDAERAVVAIATTVQNESINTQTVSVATEIRHANGGSVASDTAPVTLLPGESAVVRQRLYVDAPELWSVDRPYLYRAETVVRTQTAVLDQEQTRFGIRTLRLDPRHGLRINGETVKLRGACVHHDNGILGAAAIARAEERRVQRLKQAGFNAIRSSHNPISRAMLDACDEVGMLVMDETFDMWTEAKTNYDYSLSFPEWWERDVEAMVHKDFNHPSVVLYCIGNEIFETGRPVGSTWGRKLAEKIRSIDDTRYVTNAINNVLAVLPDVTKQRGKDAPPLNLNEMMGAGGLNDKMVVSDLVTEKTAESYGVLDIAGMNYSEARYAMDRDAFPNRIIVGTETFPTRIDSNWKLVKENGHVLGDFTWTGWEYLGEAGIGRVDYPDENYKPTGPVGPYPWLVGGCGDIDLTGHRRPASYYREIVFGLRHEPYIAVRRPEYFGRDTVASHWAWTDSVSSWSWGVPEGSPVKVEVYSDADEVELLVNGRSLGRKATGEANRFRAEFDTVYEPGELVAIGYSGGREQGRMQLRSAVGPVRLDVCADRTSIRADDSDLAFVD